MYFQVFLDGLQILNQHTKENIFTYIIHMLHLWFAIWLGILNDINMDDL